MPASRLASSASATTSPAAAQAAGAERALVLGDWSSAAELGLSALASGGGGAAAARGGCVAVQALFELGRFDEAHPGLVAGFGHALAIPPDVLMLWAALGLDAGCASTVAAELAAYLDAAAVPGGRGPPPRTSSGGGGGPATAPPPLPPPAPPAGPVLTREQYETAARLLLVEALCREAGRPDDAVAWADGGGLAPLSAERAAALRGELGSAAAAARAGAAVAAERAAMVSDTGAGAEAPPAAARPAVGVPPSAFEVSPTPAVVEPRPPAPALSDGAPAGLGGGPTVALGPGGLGPVARSASFLAATPERLADLWRGASEDEGGGGRAPVPPPPAPPPPLLSGFHAAAAAAAAGVIAYAAFAERRALGRALRSAAARLGMVEAARAAVAVTTR